MWQTGGPTTVKSWVRHDDWDNVLDDELDDEALVSGPFLTRKRAEDWAKTELWRVIGVSPPKRYLDTREAYAMYHNIGLPYSQLAGKARDGDRHAKRICQYIHDVLDTPIEILLLQAGGDEGVFNVLLRDDLVHPATALNGLWDWQDESIKVTTTNPAILQGGGCIALVTFVWEPGS